MKHTLYRSNCCSLSQGIDILTFFSTKLTIKKRNEKINMNANISFDAEANNGPFILIYNLSNEAISHSNMLHEYCLLLVNRTCSITIKLKFNMINTWYYYVLRGFSSPRNGCAFLSLNSFWHLLPPKTRKWTNIYAKDYVDWRSKWLDFELKNKLDK